MPKLKISTRGLLYRWHQLLGTKKISIDNAWISTDLKDVTPSIQRMLLRKTYEHHERDIIKEVLSSTSRVLEIGTGIGLISLIARKIAYNGQVRSYEANPNMEKIIHKNYSLNDLEPDLHMKAVTANGKPISFFIDDEILSSSLIDLKKGHSKTTVESDKFSTIMKEFAPDTIIMDVEGAEIDLLDGNNLESVSKMIVELHPHIVGDEKIAQLVNSLDSAGFTVKTKLGKVVLFAR